MGKDKIGSRNVGTSRDFQQSMNLWGVVVQWTKSCRNAIGVRLRTMPIPMKE